MIARAAPGSRTGSAQARGGNRRARRAHAAAPLGRGVLAACWRARRTGCRRGATCSCVAAGWRRAARSAAGASSPASRGEQYAAPEAIGAAARCAPQAARQSHAGALRRRPAEPRRHPHPRRALPSLSGNRVLYRDGVPIALLAGGEVSFLTELPSAEQWAGAEPAAAPPRAGGAGRSCLERRGRWRALRPPPLSSRQLFLCSSCHFCTAAIVFATCLSGSMAVYE